ncbi:transferrin-binding protein-like solute binding protein, partial [Glaesserella parasuis]|nr:transferrin-binding protein-like solute binding protein [Glaesserella parasuis]
AANKAAQDLAKAQEAVRNAEAATAAEQAKAQKAAEKAERDLAVAQEAVRNAEAATAAEQAKAQAAAEKAAQDLAKAQEAVRNAEAATAAEQAKAQAAANKAAQDLAKAQEAVRNAEAATAAEQAKAQKAAEKAERDLAAAQEAVRNAEAATAAEQAKAQAAAEKAAQDLAKAQEAVRNAEAAMAAEQAKAQAAQDLAAAQNQISALEAELAPVREEAERKRQEAEAEEKKWEFLKDGNAWRYVEKSSYDNNSIVYGGEDKVGQLVLQNQAKHWALQKAVNFNESGISDNVSTLPIYATRKTLSGDKEVQVANAHFVNQQYSTYINWSYNSDLLTNDDVHSIATYIALPTTTNSDYLKSATTATYSGKAIKKNWNNNLISTGDFSLTANFQTEKVTGAITNLDGRDYVFNEGNISVSPKNNLIFSGIVDMTELYGGIGINTNYKGVFAGPNAEEVVGTAGNRVSFGGKRQ